MSKINIVMVNYLNALPFEYGLQNYSEHSNFTLIKDTPAHCAALFHISEPTITLMPVGALPTLTKYHIISDYCISCEGRVRTVCLFSNNELKDCHTIYLDNHSRTSVLLVKLLIKDYFNLPNIQFISSEVNHQSIKEGEAVLMIGDKVFDHENDFAYTYDLGQEWKNWKELPFVFAVWVSNQELNQDIQVDFNNHLKFGIDNIDKVVEMNARFPINLHEYYTRNIEYGLSPEKWRAMQEYLQLTSHLTQIHSVK